MLTRRGVLDNRASYKADMPTCSRRNRTSSRNGSHRRALQNAAGPLQDAAVDGHYSRAPESLGVGPISWIAFFEHSMRLTHSRVLPMFDS
jgi:hypothetical protein